MNLPTGDMIAMGTEALTSDVTGMYIDSSRRWARGTTGVLGPPHVLSYMSKLKSSAYEDAPRNIVPLHEQRDAHRETDVFCQAASSGRNSRDTPYSSRGTLPPIERYNNVPSYLRVPFLLALMPHIHDLVHAWYSKTHSISVINVYADSDYTCRTAEAVDSRACLFATVRSNPQERTNTTSISRGPKY